MPVHVPSSSEKSFCLTVFNRFGPKYLGWSKTSCSKETWIWKEKNYQNRNMHWGCDDCIALLAFFAFFSGNFFYKNRTTLNIDGLEQKSNYTQPVKDNLYQTVKTPKITGRIPKFPSQLTNAYDLGRTLEKPCQCLDFSQDLGNSIHGFRAWMLDQWSKAFFFSSFKNTSLHSRIFLFFVHSSKAGFSSWPYKLLLTNISQCQHCVLLTLQNCFSIHVHWVVVLRDHLNVQTDIRKRGWCQEHLELGLCLMLTISYQRGWDNYPSWECSWSNYKLLGGSDPQSICFGLA